MPPVLQVNPYYCVEAPSHEGEYLPETLLPIDAPQALETRKQVFHFWWTSLGLLGFLMVLLVAAINVGFIVAKSAGSLPDISLLSHWHPSESSVLYDVTGKTIANIYGDEDRTVVSLGEMSPYIKKALLAIEDTRFYQHNGIDLRGTARAIVQNLKGGDLQGGSTITQQLVKNLFLTSERSVGRKLAEAILAIRVEQHYSKDRILELYLNQVYFGNFAYGIEKAAQRYYGVSARDLTIAQSALLAGMLKAPSQLSPYHHPERAKERQKEVLGNMLKYGYISNAQYAEARQASWKLKPQGGSALNQHPYFVSFVLSQLEDRFGPDTVRRGGLKVYTTISSNIQAHAEKVLQQAIIRYRSVSSVDQGALVAMDLNTGHVIALVGGADYQKSQFNTATMGMRSIGSTVKPFVYLTGLRMGRITPSSPILDAPLTLGTWKPKNWDGRYMGLMQVRDALVQSRNTTTIRLGLELGLQPIIETCRLAGIKATIPENFSSLLGAIGVSPYELMGAYGTLARGGLYQQPTPVARLLGPGNQSYPLPERSVKRVFEERPVKALAEILETVVSRGTGRNAALRGHRVAGKTGTTDQQVDLWFAGFSEDVVAVVWLGNSRNKPLKGLFSSHAASVWHDFMEGYYRLKPELPQGVQSSNIGILAQERTLPTRSRSPQQHVVPSLVKPPLPSMGIVNSKKLPLSDSHSRKSENTSPAMAGEVLKKTGLKARWKNKLTQLKQRLNPHHQEQTPPQTTPKAASPEPAPPVPQE
ncbi:MAG: transglycosylase domain-containing protein [Vampirovibrionales bacterium]